VQCTNYASGVCRTTQWDVVGTRDAFVWVVCIARNEKIDEKSNHAMVNAMKKTTMVAVGGAGSGVVVADIATDFILFPRQLVFRTGSLSQITVATNRSIIFKEWFTELCCDAQPRGLDKNATQVQQTDGILFRQRWAQLPDWHVRPVEHVAELFKLQLALGQILAAQAEIWSVRSASTP
jgi:hypothetical protein